jgi:CSLREA domain-containing protein
LSRDPELKEILIRRPLRLFCVIGIVLVLSFYYASSSRAATTFTVNSLLDTGDATPDGACNDGAGNCTLREAIQEANALAGADTINITATGIIQLTTALPDLSTDITISGPSASLLSVRGEGAADRYRIFTVAAGAKVNISGAMHR